MTVLKALDAIAWVKQRDTLGLSYAPETRQFEATAAGAAGGTTIRSSTLASQGDDGNASFPGRWIEVIDATNGPAGESGAPLRRMIKQYVSSTFTATIDALPFQTAAGDSFKLLDPPHGYFCTSTAGSQVNLVDDDRTETNDYWVGSAEQGGHYVEVIRSAAIADTSLRLCLDFDAATDTLSCASLGANTAIGELFEVWQFPEISNATLVEGSQPRLDRAAITGSIGMPRGVAGLREGSGQLEMLFRGPGRGREGLPAEIDTLLGAVADGSACASLTVSSAGSTVSIPYAGVAVAGNIYATEDGDVFVASVVGGGTITPSPSLRTVPAENSTIYGLRKYVSSDGLNYAVAFKAWHGKEEVTYAWGCAPSVAVAGTRGDYLKITSQWQAADSATSDQTHLGANYARGWKPRRSTIVPRMLGDTRAVIDGVELDARSFAWDLGLDHQPHVNLNAPNGTDGFEQVRDAPSGTLELWLDDNSKDLRQKSRMGKPVTMLIQAGEHPGEPGVCAFWAYEVELTTDEDGDESGQRTVTLGWRATEDQTTTLPRWVIGIG